jgi:hypothetical protein
MSNSSRVRDERRYEARVNFILGGIPCKPIGLLQKVLSFFLQVFKRELGVQAGIGIISLSTVLSALKKRVLMTYLHEHLEVQATDACYKRIVKDCSPVALGNILPNISSPFQQVEGSNEILNTGLRLSSQTPF